jgi:O-antigen ligase
VRPRDTLAWIVVAVLFIDLTFFSGASNFLASPQSRILNQLLVFGALVGGGVLAWGSRPDLRSPVLLPGAAWLAANTAATLTSQRPAASTEALALLLLGAPAYLLVRAVVTHPAIRTRFDSLLIVATTVFVIAYLLQALTQWASWWSVAGVSIPPLRPGDVGLTVGTVNAVALYLELLAPIAVWLSWLRWRSRPYTVGLALASSFALLVTGSRGAWLGAVVGGIVLVGLYWLAQNGPRPALRAMRSRVPLVVGVGLAGVAAVLVPTFAGRLLSGDAGRIELWSAAWSMFTSSPLVGVGPGAWPGLRPLTPISDPILAVLATCHDSVLQVLVEAGVLGLAAAAWLVVAVGRVARQAIARSEASQDRVTAIVAVASLTAAAAHSIVDTQIHLPAIVLLTWHLVARLDVMAVPPATALPARPSPRLDPRLAILAAPVAIGALLLVPIDIAMIRASLGNQALDRGDPRGALADFQAAVALHDLPAYRLGEAVARSGTGDPAGADEALVAMERDEPFTFVLAQRAFLAADGIAFVHRLDALGDYDPTAEVNSAVVRFAGDREGAVRDLAAAMARVPPLVFSSRPDGLLDDEAWAAAQRQAVERIGTIDAVTATAVATLAGLPDEAEAQRTRVAPGPELDALGLLADAVAGAPDLDAAHALLRSAPDSAGVQDVLWQLGFEAGSQPMIDAVKAVAVPLYFGVPVPPMELVLNGRADADYSLRLPRWPMASAGRNGPKRPYVPGFITIEPVYRPKP